MKYLESLNNIYESYFSDSLYETDEDALSDFINDSPQVVIKIIDLITEIEKSFINKEFDILSLVRIHLTNEKKIQVLKEIKTTIQSLIDCKSVKLSNRSLIVYHLEKNGYNFSESEEFNDWWLNYTIKEFEGALIAWINKSHFSLEEYKKLTNVIISSVNLERKKIR